jgi:hypothetical protein
MVFLDFLRTESSNIVDGVPGLLVVQENYHGRIGDIVGTHVIDAQSVRRGDGLACAASEEGRPDGVGASTSHATYWDPITVRFVWVKSYYYRPLLKWTVLPPPLLRYLSSRPYLTTILCLFATRQVQPQRTLLL